MFVLCWVAADVLFSFFFSFLKTRASLIRGAGWVLHAAPPPVAKQYALWARGRRQGGSGGSGEEEQKCIALEDSVKDRYKVRRAFQYIFIY